MPSRRYVPHSRLKDLPVGKLPDGPTITVAILAFDLVHFNEGTCVVGELRASPYLNIVIFNDQSTSIITHTVEGMTDSPGKLVLVSELVCLSTRSRYHMILTITFNVKRRDALLVPA